MIQSPKGMMLMANISVTDIPNGYIDHDILSSKESFFLFFGLLSFLIKCLLLVFLSFSLSFSSSFSFFLSENIEISSPYKTRKMYHCMTT